MEGVVLKFREEELSSLNKEALEFIYRFQLNILEKQCADMEEMTTQAIHNSSNMSNIRTIEDHNIPLLKNFYKGKMS